MKTLNNLLLESLQTNPLWTEFVRILDEQNQKDIIGPINQLLAIRDIHNVEDPEIVKNAIREQGLALTDEMMNMNLDKLHQLYHFLPLYHETSGTPRYPKFIEFLLGRDVSVSQLWTADYQSFHEKPLGPTIMEGGEWYPTNHIKVGVESKNLGDYFDLVVGTKDVASLMAIGYPEEQALGMVGRDVNNHQDANMVQTVLENRVVELFYKFAPIEEVIEQLLLSVNIAANLYISGVIVHNNKEYVSLGSNIKKIRYPDDLRVVGGREKHFHATVVFDDDSEASMPVLFEVRGGEEHVEQMFSDGAIFVDPIEQQALPVSMEVMGRKRDMTLQIVPSSDLPIPDSIKVIARDEMYSFGQVPVAVNGIFGNEEKRLEDMDSVQWSTSRDDVSIIDHKVLVPKILEPTALTIYAEYADIRGISHEASYDIQLLPVDAPLEFEDINILVDEITQGQPTAISAELVFNDGSTQPATPRWEAQSSKVTISPEQVIHSEVVYKDFKFTVVATATSLGKTIRKEHTIDSIYPKIEIFDIDIIAPDTVIGGSRHQLKCLAHWAEESDIELYRLGHKTKEEILKFSSDVVAVWRNVGTVSSITSHEVDLSNSGLMNVPSVDRNQVTHIGAMVITEAGHSIDTVKTINITPRARRIEYLDLIMQGSIEEDNTAKLRTIANWTDGTQTELYPGEDGYALTYSVVLANGNLSNNTKISDDNPSIIEYHGEDTGIATVKSTVIYDHETESGIEQQLIDQEHLLNLVPRIYLTDNMEVVAPESHVKEDGGWIIQEQERMFIRSTVTLEDGTRQDITPNWAYEVLNIEDDDHPYLEILGEQFSIDQMITILTNKSPLELYMEVTVELSGTADNAELITDSDTGELVISYTQSGAEGSIDIPVSSVEDLNVIYNHDALFGYEEFKGLKTFKDTEEVLTRTLIQTTKVTEQIELGMNASFFREEEELSLTITDRPVVAHDIVLGYKLKGPMEFLATAPAVSYALYANYDDGGEEYGVSNDWELQILNKREVLQELKWTDELKDLDSLTDEQLNEIFPDNQIVDIDDNGYVYPKHNVDVSLRITAKYDDGRTQLSDYLDVNMKRANTVLKSLRIVGPTDLEDTGDEIVTVDETGAPAKAHVPYKAILERMDGTLEAAELAVWEMQINPKTPGQRPINMNIGEDTGKLYLEPQIEDQSIILTAQYEEYVEDVLEMVSIRLPVEIQAAKHPVEMEIDEVQGTIKDDAKYLMTATVTHRDGSTTSVNIADWAVADSPIGVEIDKSGTLSIPQLVEDADVTITCRYTQGSTILEDSYTLGVTSESALQSLEIAGHSTVRDDSSIQMEAVVFRSLDVPVDYQDKPVPPDLCDVQECVTERCAWMVVTEDDRASIETTTGLLHLDLFIEDTDIVIQAIFQEQGQEVTAQFTVHVKSSLPRFGLGPYGLSSQADLEIYLPDHINNLKQGGSFTLRTNAGEGLEGYAYLAHRADIGGAVISEADGRTQHGGWSGAAWSQASSDYENETELRNIIASEGDGPIEVEVTYDNLTETWLLYRSNKPDFHLGRFAYYYRAPEPEPIPLFITLVGPDTMHEQTTETYVLQVTYDNGEVEDVPFTTFECDDVDMTTNFETGELTAGDTETVKDVEIVATLSTTYDDLTVSKTVTVTADIFPVSLVIVGPTSVDEDTVTNYTYEVTMNDGEVKTITADNFNATIGTLNSVGRFEAPRVTQTEVSKLTIDYTETDVTVNAELDVTINNSNNLPVSLEITGTTSVNEGGAVEQLTATVLFEDGSSQDVTNSCTWSKQSGSGASVGSLGTITPDAQIAVDSQITVHAEFTSAGKTVDDTHTIDVINVNKEVTSLAITGANQLDEGASETLIATAYFDDGTNEVVTDTSSWSVITGNSYLTNVDEVITAVANVTQDQNATVQAEYTYDGKTVDTTHIVFIRNTTNLVDSVVLSGPTVIQENGATGKITATATYEDGTTKDVSSEVGSNWEIVSGPATIDSTGRVTTNDITGGNQNAQARYTWNDGINDWDLTHDFEVTWIEPVEVSQSIVHLPGDSIEEGTFHQWLVQVNWSDGTTTQKVGTGVNWTTSPAGVNAIGEWTAIADTGNVNWPQPGWVKLTKGGQTLETYYFDITANPDRIVDIDFQVPDPVNVNTVHALDIKLTLADGRIVDLPAGGVTSFTNGPSDRSISVDSDGVLTVGFPTTPGFPVQRSGRVYVQRNGFSAYKTIVVNIENS